jgi:hypothetical protein
MSKPNQHLVFGPQGEQLIVTEEEARNWEAKRTERRAVENIDDEEEQEICPTCGQRKPVDDEEHAAE